MVNFLLSMRIIYFIAAAALLAGCRSEKSVQHDGVRPVKCVVARSTRYVDRDFAGLSTANADIPAMAPIPVIAVNSNKEELLISKNLYA